jgi:hypothetical protein
MIRIETAQCDGLLRPCWQRDNERDGADQPRSHAIRPDVRPQHRTRWRHIGLENMYSPLRAVYRVSGSHAERIALTVARKTSGFLHRKSVVGQFPSRFCQACRANAVRVKRLAGSKDMKTFAIAALSVVHLTSALAGTAQQADSLQVNASYQCSNGMTVTVIRCEKQNAVEYCEFKVEQNGKLAFQGVNLREKVAAGVKSCRAQAANSPKRSSSPGSLQRTMAEPGKSFDPPYLNDMPSIELVKQEIQGKDATDTLARQVAVFNELPTVITRFMLADRKRYNLTADEQKITGKYQLAAYELEQGYKKTHTPVEAQAFVQLHGRYELDSALDREMHIKLFTSAFLLQLGGADKARNQWYQAHLEQEKHASEEAAKEAKGGGSPFVRNDPGTLAARRCVELGGSALECVGKGFWTGLTDLAGFDVGALGGFKFAGVTMNGTYQGEAGLSLNFGPENFSLNACGKLVPNGHPYTIVKKPNQLLINVKSEPTAFVLSMKNDGSLSGPGPINVKGQIIVGYRKIWMQEYINNIAVAGRGYWTSEPIYAPKTERCTIGTLAQVPAVGPDKNPLTRDLTAAIDVVMAAGPPGLRMSGQFTGQGGLALEFADDAVTLDCAAAHAKQPYTVENAPTQFQITIKNGAAPFTLTVQPNGTLLGSGNAEVAGRVVTGSTETALTYAAKNARCPIGTLTPKGGATAQVSQ